ncbi:MAG: hypothetical protein FD181_2679 [Prolixibacteraceae bacterium]|nr:MAG: hypothetical protein FD181_2679 [Prolixibacteraceae bacterium]
MKTFKLFANRQKPKTYQILSLEGAKKMSLEDELEYVLIDVGTHPYLVTKVKKLSCYVGQSTKTE